MRRIVQISVSILLLIIGSIYIYYHRDNLQALKGVSTDNLVFLTLVTFSFFCATGLTFKLLVNVLNIKLNWTETVGLSILSNFTNYMIPGRPGAALKAVYLKSTKKLEFSKFTAILAANMFIALFMMGISGMLIIPLTTEIKSNAGLELLLVCMALVVVSVLPFVTKLPQIKLTNRKGKILRSALEGFQLIRSSKKELFLVCFSFILQFILAAVTIKIAYTSLGFPITLTSALIVGVFTAIANLFTITPNNIGIQEIVIGYLVSIVGLDFASGIIGAVLMRVIHIIITFGLTPLFVYLLLKDAGINVMSPEENNN